MPRTKPRSIWGDDLDFWAAFHAAPRATGINGTALVDIAAILPGYMAPTWWPIRDLMRGSLPC